MEDSEGGQGKIGGVEEEDEFREIMFDPDSVTAEDSYTPDQQARRPSLRP